MVGNQNNFLFNFLSYNLLFFLDIPIYIHTKEQQDFEGTNKNISFLDPLFSVTENNFLTLANDSIVIFDDFSLQNKNKVDFLKVVNYYLRHHHITLFLVIHNLYNTGLVNEILISPHIFLAYTNLGYYILK